jgi:putative lipoprotein
MGICVQTQTMRAEGEAAEGTITGTLTYLQRIALPADAIVTISLLDVSFADRRTKLVTEQKFPTAGKQVPIPFSLSYKTAEIDPARMYILRATISSGGRLLFASNMSNRVLTRGAGSKLDLTLQQVGAAPIPPPATPPTAATGPRLEGEKLELRRGDEVTARFESRHLK